MAGFLSKFARGAAGKGAELYADEAKSQMMAQITAKRDEVLAANRAAAQEDRQAFSTEQTQQSQEFQRETQKTAQADRMIAIEKRGETDIKTQQAKPKKVTADKKINRTKMITSALKVIQGEQEYLVKGVEGHLTPKEQRAKAISETDLLIADMQATAPAESSQPSVVDQILQDFSGKASQKEILKSIMDDSRMSQEARNDAKRRLLLIEG
jgi:hypothetical protein